METFEADKIKRDVNKLFAGLQSGIVSDVIICKRCQKELNNCICPQKCQYNKHGINCECSSLYDLMYHIAEGASEGMIKAKGGFLI
jgi:hypothetical protein